MNRRTVVSAIGVVLLAAACSAGGPGASTTAPTSVPTSQPSATAAGSIAVEVATSSFGQHLTASGGKALYVLTNDSANTSTCSGDCAGSWPPFVLTAGQTTIAAAGVTATLATMTRSDGATQVTANGLPLYFFSGDTAAGDVNGQGLADVWFLAAPDGSAHGAEAVGTPTTAPGTPSMPVVTDDGYGDEY
jgi:predicted lipoprotein with Yx(FWY)xxD motif